MEYVLGLAALIIGPVALLFAGVVRRRCRVAWR